MRLLAFISVIAYSANPFVCAIIRGHDAKLDQCTYVVRLSMHFEKPEFNTCAGALISPTWVLTAAHCVANAKMVRVYLGSVFKNRYKVGYIASISDIIIHPHFKNHDFFHDIALIKTPPTEMCQKIGIIRLPKIGRNRLMHSYPKYEKTYGKVYGWGQTSWREKRPTKLQWGRVQILGREDCRYITKDELCTVIDSNLASPYLGDSGGPLVSETSGELVGIVSCGRGKNRETGHITEAIYTQVTSYLKWIKSVSGVFYR